MNKKKGFIIDNYQAILFDFDGVLCECMDVKTKAFEKLFEPHGEKIVKKVIDHHIKYGGISRYKKIQYYYSEYLNKDISGDELNKLAKKFSDLVITRVIESDWVKGAKKFLEKYYKKIDLYIVSGTPQEELRLIVKKRRMIKYFKGIYGTPDTKPIHIKQIIFENGYSREKLLYIGDSLSDYQDAINAGIIFLGRSFHKNKQVFPKGTSNFLDFTEIMNENPRI